MHSIGKKRLHLVYLLFLSNQTFISARVTMLCAPKQTD